MTTSISQADDHRAAIHDLRRAPGVGASVAGDLYDLGYRTIADLCGQSPQAMYDAHCEQSGVVVDRCLLYTFRCAVYFSETTRPDPEKLKWWNWKDVT